MAQAIAMLIQGSLLVRFAPDYVADAFCASRLTTTSFGGGAFGNLPPTADFAAILERAWPG
jgi:putative acyl-CoA dehydrogenase